MHASGSPHRNGRRHLQPSSTAVLGLSRVMSGVSFDTSNYLATHDVELSQPWANPRSGPAQVQLSDAMQAKATFSASGNPRCVVDSLEIVHVNREVHHRDKYPAPILFSVYAMAPNSIAAVAL